jgi:N12 class adenine-specific DNA methylase/adenine-specific DNA methylase
VNAALDLKLGKAEGGKLTPEEDAHFEAEIRPQLDGIISQAGSAARKEGRQITPDTPLTDMSVAEFKRHRPEQALQALPLKDEALQPENWTTEGLSARSKNELEGLTTFHGLTTSGTKAELAQRLVEHRDLAKQYAHRNPEDLAKELSGAQLEALVRQLGAPNYGNKSNKAHAIVNTFAQRKAKGESALAEYNYNLLLNQQTETPANEKNELNEISPAAPAAPAQSADPEQEFARYMGSLSTALQGNASADELRRRAQESRMVLDLYPEVHENRRTEMQRLIGVAEQQLATPANEKNQLNETSPAAPDSAPDELPWYRDPKQQQDWYNDFLPQLGKNPPTWAELGKGFEESGVRQMFKEFVWDWADGTGPGGQARRRFEEAQSNAAPDSANPVSGESPEMTPDTFDHTDDRPASERGAALDFSPAEPKRTPTREDEDEAIYQANQSPELFGELRDDAEGLAREAVRLQRVADDPATPKRNRVLAQTGFDDAKNQLSKLFRVDAPEFEEAGKLLRNRLADQHGFDWLPVFKTDADIEAEDRALEEQRQREADAETPETTQPEAAPATIEGDGERVPESDDSSHRPALDEPVSAGSVEAPKSRNARKRSGTSGGTRRTRTRTVPSGGQELDASGGSESAGVGDTADSAIEHVTDTLPPRASAPTSVRFEHDYRIPNERLISGSPEARAKSNLAAIRVLRQLETENRRATVEEQETLARYVGWGAVPQLFAGNTPEWKAAQEELKSLISSDEYESAQRSTTNSHYTGDDVVDAMWRALEHLGAKPGMSWLEPAVGVGNFFGRQPAHLLEGARRMGMDKDALTSAIAKYLYPDSGIDTKAFEEAELPADYFDGIISNVPFGDFGVHDPAFRGKPYLTNPIHNYFFAKSLDYVRPGGVVAFVTSRYTMDGYDKPHRSFREYVAKKADFLGAVRLPTNAFKQSSGTHVITDLIFLRKRLPGAEPSGPSWVETSRKHINYYPIETNKYYQENPSHILGTETLKRGQFSAHDYAIEGQVTRDSLAEKLKEVLPADAFQKAEKAKKSNRVALRELNAPAEQSKLGALFFDDKGDLYRKTSKGSAEPVSVAAAAKDRIRGQMKVRDVLAQLLAAEQSDQPTAVLNSLRKSLNTAYDAFVKKYGPLSMRTNTQAMYGDPDAPLLVTLERKFDPKSKSAEKAPIFTRRMLEPARAVLSAKDAKDALYISLNESGRLDWDRMAQLTGQSPEALQKELSAAKLVFLDPKSESWQTGEEYLSGSVRAKLREARQFAKVEPQYQANVEALEAVQPEDIAPGDISALLGVTWVPGEVYGQFAQEVLNASQPLQVNHVGNEWIVGDPWGVRGASRWSTARVSAHTLLKEALNMRRVKVYDKDAEGNVSVNKEETLAAQAKQREMQKHFNEWLFQDGKRATEMARIYNDLNNDLRLRTYDGSHLTLPGMTRDLAVLRGGDLEPHQKAAIWRTISQRNVLLAHWVGTGKTFEMIASGMELQRLGLIKRPMYVVPNATLTGWQLQFNALYPQKRVLVFSEKDLEKKRRQQVMAQIATGDWDAVVVPESSFGFLRVGDQIFEEHYQKLAGELESQIKDAEEAGLDTRIIKRLEKAKERLLTGLRDRRNAERQDHTVSWEQLGIDQLFVDEAHNFKKLGFTTKQQNVAGIDQNGNQKTFDLLMKIHHTQKHGRGVVFASGTPVTNTMGELFNLMKYLIEPEMEARGLSNFDDWSANYGRTVDVFEPKPEGGGYQMKARFSQFVNLPELAQLFRSFADVVTSDMVDLPRPAVAGGGRRAIELQLSEAQEEYLKGLRSRAETIRDDPRKAMPDNMLAVYGDAGKMTLDMRLVDRDAQDEPGNRLNRAADEIYRLWRDTKETRSTQLVFSDLGIPLEGKGRPAKPKEGKPAKEPIQFSIYDELTRKLIERGIPANEIAHVYSAKNKTQRAQLFQATNDGKIRVLMGSTQKLGVGVNVQQKVVAMHHLDVPHRPADLDQREGRGLRQGNENPEVHVLYYVTKGSLDESKFANVLRKAKFINQVLQGKSTVRTAEDVGGMVPSLEMFAAMASGDPRVLRKIEVDAEIDRLSSVFSAWRNEQFRNRYELNHIPDRIQALAKRGQRIQAMIAQRDKVGRVWTVGKQKFEGEGIRDKVAAALDKIDPKKIDSSKLEVIGTAYGFPLVGTTEGHLTNTGVVTVLGLRLMVDANGNMMGHVMSSESSKGLVQQVENELRGLEQELTDNRESIAQVEKDGEQYRQGLEKPWPYTAEFEKLQAEQKQLIKDLGADKGDDSTAAFTDGAEIVDDSVQAETPDTEDEEEGGEEDEEESAGTPVPESGAQRQAREALEKRKREGERGSLPINAGAVKSLFTGRKDGEPERVYSGLGATKSRFVRNLSQVGEASPAAHQAAVQAATSRAQTSVLMRKAMPQVTQALGGKISRDEFLATLIESRLQGLAQRWRDLVDEVEQVPKAELVDWVLNGPLQLLAAMSDDGELAQSAAALASNLEVLNPKQMHRSAHDRLRTLVSGAFEEASDSVHQMMPADEFDRISQDPHFQKALQVYKKEIEPVLAESHASNEGVFSDALGPLDTYYPLIPVRTEDQARAAMGARKPFKKPANIANQFATGLSDDYSTKLDDLQERVASAFSTNNKAALLDTLEQAGILHKLKPSERADTVTFEGREFAAHIVETKPARTIVQDGKVVHIGAQRAAIPEPFYHELKPILEPNAKLPAGLGKRLLSLATQLTLAGPADAVYHAHNLIGALVGNTPFLGTDFASQTIGNTPFTKTFTAIVKMVLSDPMGDEATGDLMEMAKLGLLPERFGRETYSKKYAEETGAERKRPYLLQFGPTLYGPKGLDVRARLVMYRAAKAINPQATGQEMFAFVNQLGNYTESLQGHVERALKSTGLSPFYTAGSTMLRNGIDTILGTGAGSGPGGGWKNRLKQMLSGALPGLAALWVLTYKLMTGKYPWQDKDAQLLKIVAPDQLRRSKVGLALWGHDMKKKGQINFSVLSPLVGRGARALGLSGAWNTHQAGGNAAQMVESSRNDVVNSLVHPLAGPVVRAGVVLSTGKQPYLIHDRQGGSTMLPAVDKHAPIGSEFWSAAKELNSFYGNIAAATGLMSNEDPKATRDEQLLKAVLAMTGAFSGASNVNAAAAALRAERKQHASRRR